MSYYEGYSQGGGRFTIFERDYGSDGCADGCSRIIKWGLIAFFVYLIFHKAVARIGESPTGWQIAKMATAAVAIFAILIFVILIIFDGLAMHRARKNAKKALKRPPPDKSCDTSRNEVDGISKVLSISLLTFIISAVLWVIITLIISLWIL